MDETDLIHYKFSTGQTWQDLLHLANLAPILPPDPPSVLLNNNYIPQEWGAAMISVYLLTGMAALITLLLRLARWEKKIEDFFVVISAFMMVTFAILACIGAKWLQWGYKSSDLKIKSITDTIKVEYACQFLILWGSLFLKIAILLQLRRQYKLFSKRYIWYCNVTVAITVMLTIGCTLGFIFQCPSISAGYDLWGRIRTNCNSPAFRVPIAVSLVISNFIVLLVGWKLGLKRKPVGVLIICGIIPFAASIARCYYWRPTVYLDWQDHIRALLCSQIELTSAIIFCCIPSVAQFGLPWPIRPRSEGTFNVLNPAYETTVSPSGTLRAQKFQEKRKLSRREEDETVLQDDPFGHRVVTIGGGINQGNQGNDQHYQNQTSDEFNMGSPFSDQYDTEKKKVEFDNIVFDGDAEREKMRLSGVQAYPAMSNLISPTNKSFNTASSPTDKNGFGSQWKSGHRLSTISSVYDGEESEESLPDVQHNNGREMISNAPISQNITHFGQNMQHNHMSDEHLDPMDIGNGPASEGDVSPTSYRMAAPQPPYPAAAPAFAIPDTHIDDDEDVSPTASARVLPRNTYPSYPDQVAGQGLAGLGIGRGLDLDDPLNTNINNLSGGSANSAWRHNPHARLSTVSSYYERDRENSTYSMADEGRGSQHMMDMRHDSTQSHHFRRVA